MLTTCVWRPTKGAFTHWQTQIRCHALGLRFALNTGISTHIPVQIFKTKLIPLHLKMNLSKKQKKKQKKTKNKKKKKKNNNEIEH